MKDASHLEPLCAASCCTRERMYASHWQLLLLPGLRQTFKVTQHCSSIGDRELETSHTSRTADQILMTPCLVSSSEALVMHTDQASLALQMMEVSTCPAGTCICSWA